MLKVLIERLEQSVIVKLRGSLTAGRQLDAFPKTLLSQIGAGAVFIDMARVTRIDAAGLGVLLKLRETLQLSGLELRLMNVTRLVQQVLKISCLDTVFEISSPEAVLADSMDLATSALVGPGKSGAEDELAEALSTGGGS